MLQLGGMRKAADRTDPRTIITPDAFSVAPELLNLPLAHPWRRAVAILLDLILVAILANAPAVFFAFAAGLFVFTLVARSRREGLPTGRRVLWVTLGCMGAITVVVAGLAITAALLSDSDTTIAELEDVGGRDVPVSAAAVADLVRLARGGDSAEVAAAAERMVERLSAEGVTSEELRSLVDELRREDGAGASRALEELERAVAGIDTSGAVRSELDADTLALDSLVAAALEERASEVRRLESRIERLEDDLQASAGELEEARSRGILATVYALLDDVGLSVGWAGLYFTFFLGWWKGRTPGKRLLGIRVVRLDGRPLGYWVSFERYGGYAASLFTGLEGFARIFWDPNRQALEDRLAGTVVVFETAEARERIANLHERTAPAA